MNKKMMLFLVLLLLFSILLINYSYLQEKEKEEEVFCFLTGNDYLKFSDHDKLVYVEGLFDMYSYFFASSFPEPYYDKIDKYRNMTAVQIKAIFDKFLEEHPEAWHFAAADIFFATTVDL